MSTTRNISVVDALFGAHLDDKELLDLPRRHYGRKKRHASLQLPDLKTIVVVQNTQDIDDVSPLLLRTGRHAYVEHEIGVWRKKRVERVGIQIALLGLIFDDSEIGDPEVDQEIREELELTPAVTIIQSLQVVDMPDLKYDNFYFDENGNITDRTKVDEFIAGFERLRTLPVLTLQDPVLLTSLPFKQ